MRASTLLTAAVWLGIAVAVYAALTGIVRSRQAQVLPVLTAPGELQVPRGADGHFHILGSINGVPVRFLVDTGASLVTVSESFARRAGLQGGTPIVFQTANGALSGRVVGGAHVEAGGLALGNVRVGVGLAGTPDDVALLGQSFLSRFDLMVDRAGLRLRSRE